jgi:hypothetical protein
MGGLIFRLLVCMVRVAAIDPGGVFALLRRMPAW